MLPDARQTLAHSSLAWFCISLQYSSERFSDSAVTTDWIRSLADEMSRLGDCSWSEANLVIWKMSSNKMRRKTNCWSMHCPGICFSPRICLHSNILQSGQNGREWFFIYLFIFIAHNAECWHAQRVSLSFFNSTGCSDGSSSFCFFLKMLWTTEPEKKIVEHLYNLEKLSSRLDISYTVH